MAVAEKAKAREPPIDGVTANLCIRRGCVVEEPRRTPSPDRHRPSAAMASVRCPGASNHRSGQRRNSAAIAGFYRMVT
jgi:hypothetical protein